MCAQHGERLQGWCAITGVMCEWGIRLGLCAPISVTVSLICFLWNWQAANDNGLVSVHCLPPRSLTSVCLGNGCSGVGIVSG
jgi:hypothetical protein